MYDDVKCSENYLFFKLEFYILRSDNWGFPNDSKTIFKNSYLFHCLLLLCFWKNSFKNRKKRTSHTNTNYASICNYWVDLLTILIFYFYYDLIDKVFPYFWSVIINNYIYFNKDQNSPRFFLSSTSFSIH